jgi:hypothetical protein
LRSTSLVGFAGVPNPLNLELNFLGLYEFALVFAPWRVVLHCSRRNALLHCAWLVVRMGVLCCIVVGGDPRTHLLRCARPQRCAWLCCARKRTVCILVGDGGGGGGGARPRGPLSPSLACSLCYSQTYPHSVISIRRRIMLPYSKIHQRETLRACGA